MKQTLMFLTKAVFFIALFFSLKTPACNAQIFDFKNWNHDSNAVFSVDAFRSVAIDKRGTVWVGSDLGGLYNFKDSIWRQANTYTDVTFRHIVPSNIVGDSNIWATSIGKTGVQAVTGGAYHIDTKAETITQYGSGIFGGLGSRYASSLAMSSTGVTYVACAQSITGSTTSQGGVFGTNTVNPPASSATSFTKAIQDIGDINYYSAGNRGDELWFGRGFNCSSNCEAPYIARISSAGVVLPPITAASSGGVLPFTATSASPFARAIFTDTIQGNTWVGLSTGGIAVCSPGGKWRLLTSSNSPLPAGAAVNFNAIADVDGEIWIGTTAGIFVYDGSGVLDSLSSFKMLTTANGLPSNSITDIAVDTVRSQIWVTSGVGVSRAPYTPTNIKGLVYNVFCNRPESSPDSLKLYDVLQKKPFLKGVTVTLFENGVAKDSSDVNANGLFELKKAEDGRLYTVEVKYQSDSGEIKYEYSNIKNHKFMGAILIPDSLIKEIKAFKPKMNRRCFDLKLQFGFAPSIACMDGFDVTFYDLAYQQFYNIDGITENHKRQVENLADFYTSLATVYSLGGTSTELVDKAVENLFDVIKAMLDFVKLDAAIKYNALNYNVSGVRFVLEQSPNGLKAVRDAAIAGLKWLSKKFVANPSATKIIGRIITVLEDASDFGLTLLTEGTTPAVKEALLDNFLKIASSLVSTFYYSQFYCSGLHENFVVNSAISSSSAVSDFPYDQVYNKLYNPSTNSLFKEADDTAAFYENKIDNYKTVAKVAGYAQKISDAVFAFGLVPGAQVAAGIAEGVSIASKSVKLFASAAAMSYGAYGGAQVANLSTEILPNIGFRDGRPVNNTGNRQISQLSITNLIARKNDYNQKLIELKTIYNNSVFDSATYFSKYKELTIDDSLYSGEMAKTLNSIWASDSTVILVPGFEDKLEMVVDSFVTPQYTSRNSLFYQNLAYIFDTNKSGYVGGLDSLADETIVLNDSAVNGISNLLDIINTSGVLAPAYLEQDTYAINHNHLPGSTGNFTYTFTNYGGEAQNNVSFKINQPTAGFVITSSDSIYVGTIQPGDSKQISFSFISPLFDTIGLYNITVNASNGYYRDVAGSFYTLSTGALPVTLSAFSVNCMSNKVLLKWTTQSESNNNYFEIEKSSDGNTGWSAAGTVKTSGYSNVKKDYEYTDLAGGAVYYRLKQVDNDGRFTYSTVQKINCQGKKIDLSVYPVPAKRTLNIVVSTDKNSNANIFLIDVWGRIVRRVNTDLKKGTNNIKLPVAELASGEYFLRVSGPDILRTEKITIN